MFVLTYSGAAVVLIADQTPDRGLELPPITSAAKARLSGRLPPTVTLTRPLDLNHSWTGGAGITLDDSQAGRNRVP